MALLSIFTKGVSQDASSIYDLTFSSIEGDEISLGSFKGKHILFVNVASECGFTSQYKGLEELSKEYIDNLVVIGMPCNQFGGQEPGTSKEIQNFCKTRYGVTFPMSAKVEVSGANQHPIYKWLTDKNKNGNSSSSVKWNFQKYLVGPNGKLINYFYSTTSPMSEKIIRELN
jgi:glutathione peroxidase